MCSVSGVLTGAGTALGLLGQYQQGKAQASAARVTAEYNAQMAANEANTQRQLAQNAIAEGAAERSQQQRQALRRMGQARAEAGASGLSMDSGSKLSILADKAEDEQYQAQQISQQSAQKAWQYQVAANTASSRQNAALAQGDSVSMNGSWLGMGQSLLSGINRSYGQSRKFKL